MGSIKLNPKEPVRIGFDQSSSQTGLAVKKSNGELLCLIDFVNSSRLPFNLYKSMLGMKIEQIFQTAEVEICVIEKMWGGNKKSYEMLTSLGDFITGFKYIMPGWKSTEIASILPNVWRSAYLKGPEYKGMFTKDKVKIAALKEGVKRYPFLRNYGYNYGEGKHVNDSFDALGIIEGYEEKTFSEDGSMRRVANTMTPTNHNYTYRLFCVDDLTDLKNTIEREAPRRASVEYEFNKDFPFYENIHRATTVTNKIVFMRIDDKVTRIQLMWRYGIPLGKDELIYIVGWRDNISSKLGNY